MSTDTISDELERLDKKCDDLLNLSRANQSAAASGDLDQLNSLLEQRGRLLASMDLKCLGLKDGNLPTDKLDEPLAARRSLVVEKLREVLRIDRENMRDLQNRVESVKSQLTAMSRGRQALRQYSCIKVNAGPVYVDSLR